MKHAKSAQLKTAPTQYGGEVSFYFLNSLYMMCLVYHVKPENSIQYIGIKSPTSPDYTTFPKRGIRSGYLSGNSSPIAVFHY